MALLTSAKQFRLLWLHPGERADDLTANIGVFDLDTAPSYDALSYSWDDEVRIDTPELPAKTSITCNGEDIPVTANLGRSLQFLRDEKLDRCLWVDKICINQRDIGEREQQVRYMGEIYTNARIVVVWLGDSDSNTDDVWKLMAKLRLSMMFLPPQTPDFALAWNQNLVADTNTLGGWDSPAALAPNMPPEVARLPLANDEIWRHMAAFFQRAWFYRVWTVQEVVLSAHCHVICGEHTVSWEDLCAATKALQSGAHPIPCVIDVASISLRDFERQRRRTGYTASLRSLLAGTRNLRAREVHDKVYGLLSLSSDKCASRLDVRYSRPVQELFADVARTCIDEDRSLAVLAEVGLREHNKFALASWIPDWSDSSSRPIIFNSWSADHQIFRSAGRTEPMILRSSSADTLILRGILVAPITRILDLDPHLKWERLHNGRNSLRKKIWRYSRWGALYTHAVKALNIPSTVARSPQCEDDLSPSEGWQRTDPRLTAIEMLQSALRRTLTGDLYPRAGGRLRGRTLQYHFPVYHAWKDGARDEAGFLDVPPKRVLWEHDQFVQKTMMNRRAFIAGDDYDAYLGTGLKSLQEGDWVCILLGGDTPFILRPMHQSNDVEASEIEEWTLVSECYIHGLMDGEAMEQTSKRKFKYKDFVLPSVQSSRFHSSKL